jgi:flagellar protein FlaG
MNVTATTSATAPAPASAVHEPAPRSAAAGNSLPGTGKNAPAPARAAPPADIEKALAQIQAYLKDSQRQLTFEQDAASDRTVIRVIDETSGEVIRQFPSEEVLKIAALIDAQGFHTLNELA